MTDRQRAAFAITVLFAINAMNFFDRQILGAVGEPIRKEWGLSDGAMGALGTAFTLLYAAVGIPLGRLTDRTTRTRILSAGVFVWSLLTVASGMARNYWQLFAMRLGVGVGEASCAEMPRRVGLGGRVRRTFVQQAGVNHATLERVRQGGPYEDAGFHPSRVRRSRMRTQDDSLATISGSARYRLADVQPTASRPSSARSP